MAPYIVYAVEVCTAFIFLLYIQNKWYNRTSDELDMDHIFLCLKKPGGRGQHTLSLFTPTPTGSVGIYAMDDWFHYRDKTGLLEKADGAIFKSMMKDYLVIQCQPVDAFTLNHLESLVGSEWSLFSNCITQLRPIANNDEPK